MIYREQQQKSKLKAFTLLELIIVVIIVGALAALALPKVFKVIEQSRSAEALAALSIVRHGMEMCYAMTNDYSRCGGILDFSKMYIEDPLGAPGSHFVWANNGYGPPGSYSFTMMRNGLDISGPISNFTIDCGPFSTPSLGYGGFMMCRTPTLFKIVGGGVYEGMTWGN